MSDDPVALLLTRTAAADRAAFRALYSTTSAKLMGVLLRILADRADAEDALQEVYTRVWLRAGQFDGAKGRGMTWLIALARNHAIDRLRQRPATAAAPEEAAADVPDGQPSAEGRLIAAANAARVAECFGALDHDRAAAVRGAYLDGLSYQDLAERHGVPLNTMRTWLRRALLKLRDCMDR